MDNDLGPSQYRDNAPKPPGVLRKNAKTIAIIGVALVMILIMAFSGNGTPKPKPTATAMLQTPTLTRLDSANQFQQQINDEAAKLRAQKADLEHTKAKLAEEGLITPTGSHPAEGPQQGQQISPAEQQRLAFEAERKKKELAALFASNIALSFRKEQPAPTATPVPTSMESLAAQLREISQGKLAGVPPPVQQHPSTEDNANPSQLPVKADHESLHQPSELQAATAKQYRLFEGTIIETVLTNRLNGSFTGPVNTMVTTDVYAHDHQHLLIPRGSRILGEAQKVANVGQQRLAVSFHRLIMPDGFSESLDKFTGMNQIGETGLRDQVNNHFLQIFGVSLALGAIAGIEQAGANYGSAAGGLDAYRYGTANSLSQSATRILDRYLNILPTFTIREGHRVKVYLLGDIMLPAYSGHRMAGDL